MRKGLGIGLAAVLGVVLLACGGLAAESATVVIGIPSQRFETSLTLTGSRGAGQLPTKLLSVHVSEEDAVPVPAEAIITNATGYVVFTYHQPTLRSLNYVRVPSGADVSTVAGVHYTTLADSGIFTWTSPSIPIRAVVGGPGGNTGAGTVVRLGSVPSDMSVSNPNAITGGVNREAHIVTETLFQSAERAVLTAGINDAEAALQQEASGMGYALAGDPVFSEASDHNVGDEAPILTIILTTTLQANAFSESAARALIGKAVKDRLPASRELAALPVESNFKIASLSPAGELVLSATGAGFTIPHISTQELRSHIASMRVTRAVDELKLTVPGATIQIREWPAGTPWLPILPARIEMKINALPASG